MNKGISNELFILHVDHAQNYYLSLSGYHSIIFGIYSTEETTIKVNNNWNKNGHYDRMQGIEIHLIILFWLLLILNLIYYLIACFTFQFCFENIFLLEQAILIDISYSRSTVHPT